MRRSLRPIKDLKTRNSEASQGPKIIKIYEVEVEVEVVGPALGYASQALRPKVVKLTYTASQMPDRTPIRKNRPRGPKMVLALALVLASVNLKARSKASLRPKRHNSISMNSIKYEL